MNEAKIAKILTELRTARGVTQEEIAAALSISNKTISKWENGSSSPDLSMLVALAEYYNVTTDYLLGLDSSKKSLKDIIKEQFDGLDRQQSALKLAEIVKATYPACYSYSGRTDEYTDSYIPPHNTNFSRYQISSSAFFNFAVFSSDVNLSVTQWRNSANFSWMKDEEKKEKIGKLLKFLADPDVIEICAFIHTSTCSNSFTVGYISQNTGVSCEKTKEVLDFFAQLESASKAAAHLKNGDVDVYSSGGDSLLMCILSIAYERMFGKRSYVYQMGDGDKLIGGAKK